MWKFHRICGKSISLENNCTTAKRLNPTKTASGGICFTNTPLVNDKVYEIQVDEVVYKWGSSPSLGVTTNIPSDITEISWGRQLEESWILDSDMLYKNGEKIGSYSLNLNTVQVDDKLGIMKASDSTLHFYLNGIDHVVYGIFDLRGDCWQVSIVNKAESATGAGAQVAIKKTSNISGIPANWNVDAVCEFIMSIPECAPYAAKFRSERIDGAALIELDKKDLTDFFEMPLS